MDAVYLPWLHMHQPMVFTENNDLISNLEKMLNSSDSRDRWDGKLMARAYRNPAFWVRSLNAEGKLPRVAVDFSGILLESLRNMRRLLSQIDVDGDAIGDVIQLWRGVLRGFPELIEFSGTAYAHCYFPVTPEEDWGHQIDFWRDAFISLFGPETARRVKGFWLPEMGVPAAEGLNKLVKLLKNKGYEWLIFPIEVVKDEKALSHEKRLEIACQPHILRTDDEEITVVFRTRYDFIDQQAGCDANGIYNKCIEAARITRKAGKKRPALIVPACDGENGNFMMNQFFPATFVPFFREKMDDRVSSMTITDYLKEYPPDSEIELQATGSSWTGSHSCWDQGDKRLDMKKKIEELSRTFHNRHTDVQKNAEALKALLMAETSCYIYWNNEFWFDQGEKMIEFAYQKMKENS